MGVSKQEFTEIFKERFESSYLQLSSIPNIELYIDQITTLFDNELADRKRSEDEKILTKTMVNNYSKEGILRPIKAKKYSREHIIQMSMIYLMKQTLSIQDIKKIFCAKQYQGVENFETIYKKYAELSEVNRKNVSDFFVSFCEKTDTEDDEQLLATILYLCHISSTLERVVETLIDRYICPSEPAKDKNKGERNA